MKDGIENRPELAQGAGAKPGWYGYYIRCERMKKNMEQCKAPALKGTRVCHKHTQQDEAESRQSQAIRRLGLPPLTDAHSVQTALNKVVRAIVLDEIDDRIAGIILQRLQESLGGMKCRGHATSEPEKMSYSKATDV